MSVLNGMTNETPTHPQGPVYTHTQRGWRGIPILLNTITAACTALILYLGAIGQWPALVLAPALLLPILLAAYLASNLRLTIRIENGRLHWSVIPFALSMSLPIADIISVEPVRVSFFRFGYGVPGRRIVPGLGTLYSVSGHEVVKINSKGQPPFYLGTDEPEALVEAIEAARGQFKPTPTVIPQDR